MMLDLIYLLFYILALGLFVWLVMFILQQFPLPEPFGRLAYVIVVIIAVLFLFLIILNFLPILAHGPMLR